MSLTQQQREHYAKRINGLFGGTIHATPDKVTEEAARIADVMFVEIGSCHRWIAPFAMALDFIAGQIEGMIPNEIKVLLGEKSFKEYILDKTQNGLYEIIKASKIAEAWDFLRNLQEIWLKYTDPNRKLQLCINVARRNWRSPMEIELSDA